MMRRIALFLLLSSGCDSAGPADSTGDDVVEIPSDDSPNLPVVLLDLGGASLPDCAGTLGCECVDGDICVSGLECRGGTCSPCPAGNPDCPCAAGACDLDLVCVADLCEWPKLLAPPG